MRKKMVSVTMSASIFLSMLMLASSIQPVKASSIIIISPTGEVTPPSTPIQRIGNTYIFTNNIFDATIVIRKSNIIIDGNGRMLQGLGSGFGFNITISKYAPPPGISNVTIRNTNIKDFYCAIYFNSTSLNILSRNNITNNYYGILANDASNNIFSENNITNNKRGFWFEKSSGNTISKNIITNNSQFGVALSESANNVIFRNKVTSNDFGIYLQGSLINNLLGNNITNNNLGVTLSWSRDNSISENTFVNDGLFVDDSYGSIVENNSVNGKPLIYLEDSSDATVDYAGQIVLVNCNDIRIENLDITHTDFGMVLYGTNNTVIVGNNITSNKYGIRLSHCLNNTIIRNYIAENEDCGIGITASHNNTVSGNKVTNNGHTGVSYHYGILIVGYTWIGKNATNSIVGNDIANNYDGITLWFTSNCSIIGNNITSSSNRGVWFSDCTDISFYHNNIINNTVQAFVLMESEINWDNGIEGNYWSDYKKRYPNAVGVENLGIWDTPYVIDFYNKDNYPLMNHYIPGDCDHDGIVNIEDAAKIGIAWNTTKGMIGYNPHADLNMDNAINMADAEIIRKNWQRSI